MLKNLFIISLFGFSEIIFGQQNLIFSTYSKIFEVSLDGSMNKTLLSSNEIIDIVDSKSKVYFSDKANAGIYEIDKASKVEKRLQIEGYSPKGLWFVEETNELYFADNSKKAIFKFNLLNKNISEVVSNIKDAWEVCVNINDNIIIWSEFAAENIMISDLQGNNRKLVRNGVYSLYQLEYNNVTKEIFYFQNGNANTNSGIRKIKTDGSNYKALVTDISKGFSSDFINNRLYMFVSFGDLTTYDLNGVKIETIGSYNKVNSCYFSSNDFKVYFKSDNEEIAINEINLNSKLNTAFKFNNVFSASGAIYDSLTQDIYYLNSGEGYNNVKAGSIFKYNVESKTPTLVLKDELVLAYPRDMDIDFTVKKIFWVDERYGTVFSCNLDGSNPKKLFNENFSRAITLQLDKKLKLLFIFDASSNEIFEYDYSGKESYFFKIPDWKRPTDMCYDADNKAFYISEETSKKIRTISRVSNTVKDVITHSSPILVLEIVDSTLYFVDNKYLLFSLNLKKLSNPPLKIADISTFNITRLAKINYYKKRSNGTSSVINGKNTNIEIYPNPNNGLFNIVTNSEILNIDIIASNGNFAKIDINDKINIIDLSNFSNGVYFLFVRLKNGENVMRKVSIVK